MQFDIMPRIYVWQFKLMPIAKYHNTKSWIISSYFPMNGFRETVCASTGDNQHNCAPTTWGNNRDSYHQLLNATDFENNI